MKFYTEAAMGWAMKIQEVILRAMAKRISWWQAAEIIGISDRQMRRWCSRYERYGYDGLSFFNGVRFSGMLDAYYGYDFNEPVSRTLDTRAFDVIHNGMTLN